MLLIFKYVGITAKSFILAAVRCGALNATVALSTMLIKGGNDLTTGVTGFPNIIVLAIIIFFSLIYNRLWAHEPIT